MSVRSDCGVCRNCGTVLHVDRLSPIQGAAGVDAFLCPGCKGAPS